MALPQDPVRILVVGAGLMGTSIGLAASAAGARVFLTDHDPARAALSARMGAGVAVDPAAPPAIDLVVVAVPPAHVGRACVEALAAHPMATVTHVCSVQSQPALEVEAQADAVGLSRFVGGHPIAGREVSGPTAASVGLFVERPWAVCPVPQSSAEAVADVVALARLCRAEPVLLDGADHDTVLARLSHVPQLVASSLAAALVGMHPDHARLAGTGLRDTTRLADSDPALWGQIAAANAAAVAEGLRAIAEPLLDLARRLDAADPAATDVAVQELLTRGRAGRALLPGKHGRPAVPLAVVRALVPDSPGALARLLADIATDGVNVEDIRVEHAPGHQVGVAELAVAPADKHALLASLATRGWAATEGADAAM